MAQWTGQFSGNTHATRVADIEASLRLAVAALRHAEGSDAVDAKGTAVHRLAARLWSARLRMARARLAGVSPLTLQQSKVEVDVAASNSRNTRVRADGIAGILAEFGVADGPATGAQ